MSQLNTITSPRTCNGRSDLTSECGHIENQGVVRRDFRVSTVTTTLLPIRQSAHISVCVYTYGSSNLEEAHLQKHSTANLQLYISTEEDLSTNEALLLPRMSAQAKFTYREDTLRLKHIEEEKPYFD